MRKRPIKLTDEELKTLVWNMPPTDRISLLTLSVLDRDKSEPIAAVLGLIALVSRLSQYFSDDQRWRLAERLRTAADHCEKSVLVE